MSEHRSKNERSVNRWTQEWASSHQLPCDYKAKTGSTNDDAKRSIHSSDLQLFLSDHQEQGRGRGTNKWTDQSGQTLLSSWSFSLNQAPQPILSPLIGLAVYKAAMAIWSSCDWSLKAPNDLYLNDKKIAGLLIETIQQGPSFQVVIGLGFNIFSSPLAEAVALEDVLGEGNVTETEWFMFLDNLIWEFRQMLLEGVLPYLSESLRGEVLAALNKKTSNHVTYDEVLADGTLRQGANLIPWTSL